MDSNRASQNFAKQHSKEGITWGVIHSNTESQRLWIPYVGFTGPA